MSKILIAGLIVPLAFSSCSTMENVRESAATATNKVKYFSINDLRPAGVDVVEVRENDLKEMPLGKDRAIAFDQKRRQSFWSFALPEKFKEPTLPAVNDSGVDGSLLPPKEL